MASPIVLHFHKVLLSLLEQNCTDSAAARKDTVCSTSAVVAATMTSTRYVSAQPGLALATHGSDRHARALSSDLAEIAELELAEVSAWRRVQPRERALSSTTVDVLRSNGPEARPAWTCR